MLQSGKGELEEAGSGEVAVEKPAVLIFNYFDSLTGGGLTNSIGISFFQKFLTAAKRIVVLKSTMGFLKIEDIVNTEEKNYSKD